MTISDPLCSAPGADARAVLPGIGVGLVSDPTPSVEITSLSRYRVRTDRAGLNLRAGEIVLCAPYQPNELGMVVLVRCEADGHSPGALIPVKEVDYIDSVLEPLALPEWHKPGKR